MVDHIVSSHGESHKDVVTKPASMGTIESSVTRLLVSTKHLLESLTQWARQKADDKFVSDAYVKLGNDFRAATRAFTNAGVDISDLGDVPKALRIVLESALSEAPTQKNLDRFLPNIRSIIVNLLLNLKAKQLKAKELSESHLKKIEIGTNSMRSPDQHPTLTQNDDLENTMKKGKARSSSDRQVRLLYDADEFVPSVSPSIQISTPESAISNDALAKLQKGNFILRRASKRYSAYQFAKLTNLNNNQLSRISGENSKSPDTSFEERFKAQVSNQSIKRKGSSLRPNLLTNEQTIFMRVGDQTKKVAVLLPMTLGSLRLQFVEKFGYSPGSSAFPDIYILDALSNVWFELEEHCIQEEVKEGSLLCLKDSVNEAPAIKSLESKFDALDKRLDEFSSKILSELKDFVSSISTNIPSPKLEEKPDAGVQAQQLQNSRLISEIVKEIRDVQAVLASRRKYVESAVVEFTSEIEKLKTAGLHESDVSSNRGYMQQSYAKLSEESDNLLTKVDDLQDMMEALRKDVALRGVRLGAKQLKNTRKDIDDVRGLLNDLNAYISDGKSTWKRIWEAELDKVCEEQQFFNLQDDLTSDLEEDIKKIQETFDLIEKCSLEQSKQSSSRKAFPGLIHLQEPGESLHNVRDAVMNEVLSLVPDHESRLEAIARAEKLRLKERALVDVTQFQEELGDFVEDNKFKSSGGFEELERRRQEKDSENLKLSLGII